MNLSNPLWRVGFFGAAGVSVFLAACLFFASLGKAAAQRDARGVRTWAETACVTVGSTFKPDKKHKEGEACLAVIQDVMRRANAAARAVVTHEDAQTQKADADLKVARRNDTHLRKAIKRAEAANAAVQDNRAGPEFWASLNELGGLRGAAEVSVADAKPPAAGGDAEGASLH